MSERSKKRRAERRAKSHAEYRQALFDYGENIDVEERAKGVTEAELIRRRTVARSYMLQALVAGEGKHTILNNMARIIRGQEPIARREVTKRPPRRTR